LDLRIGLPTFRADFLISSLNILGAGAFRLCNLNFRNFVEYLIIFSAILYLLGDDKLQLKKYLNNQVPNFSVRHFAFSKTLCLLKRNGVVALCVSFRWLNIGYLILYMEAPLYSNQAVSLSFRVKNYLNLRR